MISIGLGVPKGPQILWITKKEESSKGSWYDIVLF